MTENDTIAAVIAAWTIVSLTRLTLAHRRAQRAADRKERTGA